ncbi:MAG: acyl-ACP--UDP-N-acetylglucosamine O-acyltransferase [Chitinivibrionales bacterium]|nr:acyl-ACP--UDP-N-acetylglucosamine O-acyltransferase [Chitinivibrionales bacterium]
MATQIHPMAVVDPTAFIGQNVTIGPFAIVEPKATIGDNCRIYGHAYIGSYTTVGNNCQIFPGAMCGTIPQDLKYRGEETTLVIGDNTIIREYCTLHRGTTAAGTTRIGSNCAILAYGHVAHDCIIGDYFVPSNNVALGGHIEIGNHVGGGAYVAVHQFVRIGDYAYMAARVGLTKDVIPFSLVATKGDDTYIAGINAVGLERNGFDSARRMKIKKALRLLFRLSPTVIDGLNVLASEYPGDADIALIINFIKNSKRGIHRMIADEE